jgi:DNA end-binding protein Ku
MPAGKGLKLMLLRWQEELREAPAQVLTDAVPTDKEIKMAEMLVEDMAASWSPDLFHDEFKEQLEALVEAKRIAGKVTNGESPGQETLRPSDNVVDLTELLKRSLQSKASAVKTVKVQGRAANDEVLERRERAVAASKTAARKHQSSRLHGKKIPELAVSPRATHIVVLANP